MQASTIYMIPCVLYFIVLTRYIVKLRLAGIVLKVTQGCGTKRAR